MFRQVPSVRSLFTVRSASFSTAVPTPFKLERYFDKYEFTAKYIAAASDSEAYKLNDILNMADNKCMELWNNLTLGYTQTKGHPLLLKSISDYYNSSQFNKNNYENKLLNISDNNIMVLTPQEGIYIALKCIMAMYDNIHVISMNPLYQSLQELCRINDSCDLSYWDVKFNSSNNKFELCFNELESLLNNKSKLLIVNFPHNPTGFIPNNKLYNEIINFCRMNDLYLFSDEMYFNLYNSNNSEIITSACLKYDKSITLSGMSKIFGLPGLRLGWLITHNNELLNKISTYKDYTTICNNSCSEILSIIALNNCNKIINNTNNTIKNNINYLIEFCNKNNKYFNFINPNGGCTCFIQLINELEIIGSDEFCSFIVENISVLFISHNLFDYNSNNKQFIRVGLGRTNLKEALDLLHKFIQTEQFKQFINNKNIKI